MSNLKVNAKTKILEFKKKHNLLVDEIPQTIENAIQADKDILSKITMEYVEEDDITAIYFPYGITPLFITINTHQLYFKSNQLVDKNGNTVEGYDLDDYYTSTDDEGREINRVDISGDISEQIINRLVYIQFAGSPRIFSDTYHLFYPITSAGTKLYLHKLNGITIYQGSNIYFISTDSTPITNLENLYKYTILGAYLLGGGAHEPSLGGNFVSLFLDTIEGVRKILFVYSIITNTNSVELSRYETAISTFTSDEVTPL